MLGKKDLIYFYSVLDSIPLCAPLTMVSVDDNERSFCREGFILTLYLEDGSIGFGEVCFGTNFQLIHLCFYNLYFTIDDFN